MKKDLAIIFGLFLLIVVLLIFGRGFATTSFVGSGTGGDKTQLTRGDVRINVKTLSVDAEVAGNSKDRKRGLSERDSLPLTGGLLFVFEKAGRWGFWMKDMKFAIDIIWIDENKRIVDISKNVAPEPGKKDRELAVYKPASDAIYVLEINAGLSDFNNLEIGDSVNFEL